MKNQRMILSSLLNIFSLVVFSTSTSSQSTTTATPAGTPSLTNAPTTTPANNTTGGGGADAVSLSYYMFALTILGAYFIQLLEH